MENKQAIMEEYKIFAPSGDKDFEIYKRSIPYWANNFAKLLIENIPLKPNSRILDVATGTGVPLLEIAKKIDGDNGSAIMGVDIWESAIFEAKKWIDNLGLNNASVIKADGNMLPFSADTFDYVISNVGINNFENRAKIFAELSVVNKKRGYLILTTNLDNCMYEFYNIFNLLLKRIGKESYIENLHEHQKERVTISELRHLYRSNGYKISKIVESVFTLIYADSKSFFDNEFIQMGFIKNWQRVVETRQAWDNIQFEIEQEIDRIVSKDDKFTLTVPIVYIEGQKL